MAKDDYDVLVCKVLVFLYKRLRKKTQEKPEDYIAPMTKYFPVDQDYLNYVLYHMKEKKLIEDIKIIKAWGGDFIVLDISSICITPEGIAHLRDNSLMKKIAEKLPEAACIWELFT